MSEEPYDDDLERLASGRIPTSGNLSYARQAPYKDMAVRIAELELALRSVRIVLSTQSYSTPTDDVSSALKIINEVVPELKPGA